MKKAIKLALTTILFSTLIGCSAIDDLKDTIDAAECIALIEKINDEDDNCADGIADLDKLENSCGEFLTDETKELIALIRANCTDN